jgi:HK97 family phage major capsid protein
MLEKILEKVDAIKAEQADALLAVKNSVDEVKTTVEASVVEKIEALKGEFADTVTALEAKVASAKFANTVISPEKTVRGDVNKRVKEALASFYKGNSRIEKELELFADESEHQAFLSEASALTGSGAGVGGRTAYDPVFVPLRLANPLRGVSRNVSTDGATYQFRAKTGNAGPAWGYAIQNNGSATTESTNIWQLTLQDLNVQFPIRTAALDDIDGLESNVVSDMLVEFSQAEALSMVQNNDQGATSLPYGGSNGLRGLNQYAGANATYTGGTTSTAAFGTSGTASTNGLHSLATYDQITTNGDVAGASNVVYKDLINFVYALPQQYWTESAKWVVSPVFLSQIRGLTDDNGTPVFERMHPLETNGIVGRLLGFDVVVNKYLDNPSGTTATGSDATSLYPAYFGDWSRGHTIVDRLNMVLRRYDQTAPGFITFYGEKRLATSVVDPFAIIRYRSTATANVA